MNRQSSSPILADLKHRLSEIYDLHAAGAVLSWDEATYMPNGGSVARGRQLALLRHLRMSVSSIRRSENCWTMWSRAPMSFPRRMPA
jgi:Zn-dependent M32 family carboxypeptidase